MTAAQGETSWTVAQLLEATGGTLIQGPSDRSVGGISTDTRQLKPSTCFVALPGEHADGQLFVPDALAKGAGALIVARNADLRSVSIPAEVAVIGVSDTLHALGELARYRRRQHPIPIVGITGSNGKTTTKEMVAAVLGKAFEILKNQGNFNNLIGVPLTLLALESRHQAAVVEMGINIPGEMARLVEIAHPTVGLITNIQPAHLEGLCSLEDIILEKGKLWRSLQPGDLAVVNLDDERLAQLAKQINARTVSYSMTAETADVHLTGEVETDEEGSAFRLHLGDQNLAVRLPILGFHHVMNALAAAAVGWGMGLSASTIAAGLATYEPVRMRMQKHRLSDGRTLLDDSYNANPGSLLAALKTVVSVSRGKPVVAVLGEMRELGPESAALHREVGRELAKLGVTTLFTLGEMMRELGEGALEGGFDPASWRHGRDHGQILDWLKVQPPNEAWVLVKGSRSMRMERIVEGMLAA